MNELITEALKIFHKGFTPLPLEPNTKEIFAEGWNNIDNDPKKKPFPFHYKNDEDVERAFTDKASRNLGLLVPKDHIVIDIDDPAIATKTVALAIANIFVDTSNVLGRKSKPVGKIFLKTENNFEKIQLKDNDKKVMVETLNYCKNAAVYPTTVKNGVGTDIMQWVKGGDYNFKYASVADIKVAVAMLAAASVILPATPTEKGSRDTHYESLVELLAVSRYEFTLDQIKKFIDVLVLEKEDSDSPRYDKDWERWFNKADSYKSINFFKTAWKESLGENINLLFKILLIDVSTAHDWEQGGFNAGDITAADCAPREYVLDGHLQKGEVTMWVATGGVGKTSLAVQSCLQMTRKGNFVANYLVPIDNKIIFITNEESESECITKVVGAKLFLDQHKIKYNADNFIVKTWKSDPVHFLDSDLKGNIRVNTAEVSALKEYINKYEIDLVVFDPMVSFHTANENDNQVMQKFMSKSLIKIATDCNVAVLTNHHTSKGWGSNNDTDIDAATDTGRGASALANAARVVKRLAHMSTKTAQTYFNTKKLTRAQRIEMGNYFMMSDGKNNYSSWRTADFFEKEKIAFRTPTGMTDTIGLLHRPEIADKLLEDEAKAHKADEELREKIAKSFEGEISIDDIPHNVPVAEAGRMIRKNNEPLIEELSAVYQKQEESGKQTAAVPKNLKKGWDYENNKYTITDAALMNLLSQKFSRQPFIIGSGELKGIHISFKNEKLVANQKDKRWLQFYEGVNFEPDAAE